MWRKNEIMTMIEVDMEQNPVSVLDALIEDVRTDVSGKWVNKEELKAFGESVAHYVIAKLEKDAAELDVPQLYKVCEEIQDDFNL